MTMSTSLTQRRAVPAPARLSPRAPGARLTSAGLEVNVLAAHATGVDLCLLDPDPEAPSGWAEQRIAMSGPELGVWNVLVTGIEVGQHYGFRTHGTWDPAAGLRHNPHKILVDPYARGIVGSLTYGPETHGQVCTPGEAPEEHGPMSELDSLGHVPLSVVVDSPFIPAEEDRPRTPWSDTVLYEAHVRGLTMELPGVPEDLRGTYAGLAHPATVAHLHSLGVTAIELLPIHAMVSEPHLAETDLINYWGYNTLGFFAPNERYATETSRADGPSAVLNEVKGMVQLLHEAGIEVILDVVYNHTCEGGGAGLHICWRGLDNTGYYLHDGGSPARLVDMTGCGNTLDFRRSRVVQLTLDSLRFWASEVGIDGFRFDLAVTLGRDHDGFTPSHPFLVALQTDPVLNSLKLIAEPWDMGPSGWRTGQFPAPMAEWNDRFRNTIRSFWLTDPKIAADGQVGHGVRELATRLAGSVDLFGMSDPLLMRGPGASINFITAHDGFTMADLTVYEHKRNKANGENNQDGTNDNRSWNHGVEGVRAEANLGPVIGQLRRRSHRNLLAMLLFSAGTPMLTAGDEFGRTQHGNNNAYCQDNDISWVDWNLDEDQRNLLETTRFLLAQRRRFKALRAEKFFRGRPNGDPSGGVDLAWFKVTGEPFVDEHWHDPHERAIQMVRRSPDPDEPAVLMVINGSLNPVELTLCDADTHDWDLLWDSTWKRPQNPKRLAADPAATVEPLAVRLLISREG